MKWLVSSDWPRAHDVDPSLIGFLRFRPECLFRQDGENLEPGYPVMWLLTSGGAPPCDWGTVVRFAPSR